MSLPSLSPLIIEDAVARALREDLGDAGDITTTATIPASARSKTAIVSRSSGVIAGLEAACTAFRLVDAEISIVAEKQDGSGVNNGDVVLAIDGPTRGILTAERVALNFLGHLSGIATATAALADEASGTNAAISCTRKTTPGLRALEKHAVLCGGGRNHRFGLYDAVMIKDNHIAAAGGVKEALVSARQSVGHMVKIEIEVDNLEQLEEALANGADIVLLDNMSPDNLKRAVAVNQGRAVLEASGNVTVETVRTIAETGVDVISSGWITHSAPTLDLGLDFLS